MLGNLVKDVRTVNHLQSALFSHWSTLYPPEELHWPLLYWTVSAHAVALRDTSSTTETETTDRLDEYKRSVQDMFISMCFSSTCML